MVNGLHIEELVVDKVFKDVHLPLACPGYEMRPRRPLSESIDALLRFHEWHVENHRGDCCRPTYSIAYNEDSNDEAVEQQNTDLKQQLNNYKDNFMTIISLIKILID